MLTAVTTQPNLESATPMGPTSDPAPCRNCGQALAGRFCAACGQEDRPLAPSLTDVLSDAWDAITNLEGRAFQSLGRLLVRPGFLTVEYFEGRRVRWVAPVRLYLVVSLVYFGLTSLTGWGGFMISADPTGDSAAEIQEELAERNFASESELDRAAEDAINAWLPRAMFLLVPIFGLLVATLRRSAGRTYPEHLVFSLHVHSAFFAAFSVSAVVGGLVGGERFDALIQAASLTYALVYLVLALRATYGGSLRRNVAHGLLVGFTYGFVAIGTTIAIVLSAVLAPG